MQLTKCTFNNGNIGTTWKYVMDWLAATSGTDNCNDRKAVVIGM
jgi:hypothetical protein